MLKRIAIITMLTVATVGFSSVAASAQNATNNATATQQEVRSLIQKLRQKTAKLQQIRKQALKNNPDLREQQKQFSNLVQQAITEQGYDIEAGRAHYKKLTQKLKSGDLSKQERKSVMQDIAAERQSLRTARAAALQQPAVQKAGKALQKSTLAAMKKQNPEVEQLIQDMNELRSKLRSSTQKALGK